MNNWKVYLLTCSDGSYYCGVTNKTIKERIATHNSGTGSKYTRGRLPVELVLYTGKMTRSEACKLEYKVKRMPKDKKISFLREYKTRL